MLKYIFCTITALFGLNFSSGFHIKADRRNHNSYIFFEYSLRCNDLSLETGNAGRSTRIGLRFVLRLHPWVSQMKSYLNGWTTNGLKCLCSKQTEHVNSATQLHSKYKWSPRPKGCNVAVCSKKPSKLNQNVSTTKTDC